MITDKPPKRNPNKDEYLRSDRLRTIALPPAEPLRSHAMKLEEALARENRKEVELASSKLADAVTTALSVQAPPVKVLGVRPHEITEDYIDETFGDYDPSTGLIRLWMRTAIRQKPTSFGTLVSTLCHEICHHLDVVHWGFPNTFHTRGFYERTAVLYHHVRNTPVRHLVWTQQADGAFRINWPQTMRQRS